MSPLTFEPPPQLSTPRLLLRGLREEDATALFRMYADPQSARFMARAPMVLVDEMRNKLRIDLEEARRGDAVRWVLVAQSTGTVVGYLGIFRWSQRNRCAEVGYVLAREFWGQGLMKEALPVAVRFAFEQMKLHRLEALVDPTNLPSVRLLESAGLRQEGLLRERGLVSEGTYANALILGLLEQEFQRPG